VLLELGLGRTELLLGFGDAGLESSKLGGVLRLESL
jgi:hypothetical protein